MSQDTTYSLKHQIRYDKWATSYDKDVNEQRQYEGPQYIVDFLFDTIEQKKWDFDVPISDVKALDVGCGTGFVGVTLEQRGITHIDGVDLSHKMVAEAHKLGIYKALMGWSDIRYPLPFFFQNQYDLTISSGVFTLDMVLPSSLAYLIQVTKPGGLIIINTRVEWYDNYNFEGFYQEMIQKGHIELIGCRMDAPYAVGDFNAHYWAFLVKNNEIN